MLATPRAVLKVDTFKPLPTTLALNRLKNLMNIFFKRNVLNRFTNQILNPVKIDFLDYA